MALRLFVVFGDPVFIEKFGNFGGLDTRSPPEKRRRDTRREFPVSSELESHPELRPELFGVLLILSCPFQSAIFKESEVLVLDLVEVVLSEREQVLSEREQAELSKQGGLGGCCRCCLSQPRGGVFVPQATKLAIFEEGGETFVARDFVVPAAPDLVLLSVIERRKIVIEGRCGS
jgi:hypothetical protein